MLVSCSAGVTLSLVRCGADANGGGRAGGERVEAGARRCLPPPVNEPHAPVRDVRYGYAGAGHDAIHHHLRLLGLPQPCQQVTYSLPELHAD